MLREFDGSHIITLAFHQPLLSLPTATKKVALWHCHILRRLFGRNYHQTPSADALHFLLLPEADGANLHFHGLVRVPTTHAAYFTRIAPARWKAVAPKGTIDLQPLRPSDDERQEWYSYITKGSLASEVLHSSMLPQPDAMKPKPRDAPTKPLNDPCFIPRQSPMDTINHCFALTS